MHSWYRSLLLRSILFPVSGITVSLDINENQRERRRSSPTMKTRSQNEKSPVKQWWSPTILAATLVVPDQTAAKNGHIQQNGETEAQNQSKWTTFNPLSCTNSSQIVPSVGEQTGKQEEREGVNQNTFLSATSSIVQGAEGLSDGKLTSNPSSNQLEELVMTDSKDKNAPMVMLFGWAGCRDRYLKKYSDYYQKEGYGVCRFTVPIRGYLFSKVRGFSSYRKFALEIYEKILQEQPDRPIFIHVFSMNGCALFTALWDLLDSVPDGEKIKKRVHGLVFDSSPAEVKPWQAANAVSFATLGKASNLTRESYRLLLAGIFSIHRSFVWLQSQFDEKTYQKHFAYFKLLCFDDLPKDQLYLYSDADDICLRESIEHFQDLQKKQHNANIKHVKWTDSNHCEHYRTYEKEYIQNSLEFIKNTMKSIKA